MDDSGRRVSQILRVMPRGSGFSCVVALADGSQHVMKMTGAGQGAFGLYHELVATRLAGQMGLRVPEVRPIWLDADMPWDVGTDEFDDALRRSAGWNLGVQLIVDATDVLGADVDALPRDFLSCLAFADAVLVNVDRTAKNPNILRDAFGTLWAIDFGACVYWSRAGDGDARRITLPPSHFLASRGQVYERPSFTPSMIDEIFEDIPERWRLEFSSVEVGARDRFIVAK